MPRTLSRVNLLNLSFRKNTEIDVKLDSYFNRLPSKILASRISHQFRLQFRYRHWCAINALEQQRWGNTPFPRFENLLHE